VFEGEALVEAEGREVLLGAGRQATFREGGEPVDVTAAEQRWQQRLSAEDAHDVPAGP
jgi:hypothetical protein